MRWVVSTEALQITVSNKHLPPFFLLRELNFYIFFFFFFCKNAGNKPFITFFNILKRNNYFLNEKMSVYDNNIILLPDQTNKQKAKQTQTKTKLTSSSTTTTKIVARKQESRMQMTKVAKRYVNFLSMFFSGILKGHLKVLGMCFSILSLVSHPITLLIISKK